MVSDRNIGIFKTIIKPVIHFCIVIIYSFPLLVSQAQQGNIQIRSLSPQSTLQVDTTIDSSAPAYQVCSDQPDDCSLRGSISLANQLPEMEYLIELPAGVYNLLLSGDAEDHNHTGDLDIYGRVILAGEGASTTQIDGNALDRVLQIHATANVVLQDLTITDGLTSPGVNGGGIYNRGNLSIIDSVITQNVTGAGESIEGAESGGDGGSGGGIYNGSRLTIQNSQIYLNGTGFGGDRPYNDAVDDYPGEDCYGGNGGDGGGGAGIYNGSKLTIQNSQIYSNTTGSGGTGLYIDMYLGKACYAGNGGHGGGILNTGALVITQTHISANITGNGGSGGDVPLNEFEWDGGHGGDGGDGGGIYNTSTLKIVESNILDNQTGIGGSAGCGWYFNDGFLGHSGRGGGLYSSGTLVVEDSSIHANRTSAGADGCGYAGENDTGGNGGGIYTQNGTIRMLRSHVQFNTTGPGGSGSWRRGPTQGGAGGAGGGIYNQRAIWFLDDVAVTGNQTGKGRDGNLGGNGGGIYNAGTFTVNSSVIQANQTGEGGEEKPDDGFGIFLTAGSGGLGGGIFNQGNLHIFYSQVADNRTGDGGSATLYCAPGGAGGGILNQGTVQVTYSQVNANMTGNSSQSNDPEADNQEGGSGGGIYNTGEISLEYSSVFSNTTGDGGPQMNSGSGGGLYSDSLLYLNGVSLRENQVGQYGSGGFGGGAYIAGDSNIAVHNTLIADNHTVPDGVGSGIYVDSASFNIWHTTLVRNTGGDGSGLHALNATIRLTNTILVSHTVGIIQNTGSVISLDTTMWGSGTWANLLDLSGSGSITHTHNLTGTPGFVNPDLGDYHLGVGSEARDEGIHSISTTDLDNQSRPNPDTNLSDLGADEYWSPISISAVDIMVPISGTTFASIPFTATIAPITATLNVYYVWVPSPTTGQGTSTATYIWRDAGQKTVQVTAINAYSSAQTAQEIPIAATEFKVFIPSIYSSH